MGDLDRGAQLLSFLNSIPFTTDLVPWMQGVRDALISFLGDVDRVALNIEHEYRTDLPSSRRLGVLQSIDGDKPTNVSMISRWGETLSKGVLDCLPQLGYSLRDYHPPACFDYHYNNQNFAGLVLLRRRARRPTSESSIKAMTEMHPFFTNLFFSGVTRWAFHNPIDSAFFSACDALRGQFKLSLIESQVLLFRALALSYGQIAMRMSVTESAVARHVKSIHRKTGSANYIELFSRYLTNDPPTSDAPHGEQDLPNGMIMVF